MSQIGKLRNRSGFNAIELVVVILIVFLLLGLILVILPRPRGPDRFMIFNNLKQITLACHSANDMFKGIPPAFDQYGDMPFAASVHVHLLPYIEQNNLYKMYLAQEGKGDWDKHVVFTFITEIDFTLTKDGGGIQNFAANLRVFSDKGMATKFDANMPALARIEPGKANIPKSFPDGTSNTILFSTKYANCKEGGSRFAADPSSPFAAFFGQNAAKVKAHPSDPTATFQDYPTQDECLTTPLMAQSVTARWIILGLADGSVRSILPTISPLTWNLALQPNDGLELGAEWD